MCRGGGGGRGAVHVIVFSVLFFKFIFNLPCHTLQTRSLFFDDQQPLCVLSS